LNKNLTCPNCFRGFTLPENTECPYCRITMFELSAKDIYILRQIKAIDKMLSEIFERLARLE